MRVPKIIIAISTAISLLTCPAYGQFFYSGGKHAPLLVDSVKLCFKIDSRLSEEEVDNVISSIVRNALILPDEHVVDGFQVCSLRAEIGFANFMDSMKTIDGISLIEPYYMSLGGTPFLAGERFCVAFDSRVTSDQIDSINNLFNVVIVNEIEGMPNVIVLANTDSTGYRTLDLANMYYQLKETRYSHPIFGVKFHKTAYKLFDYYNEFQFHIKKVIGDFNTASVWDFAGLTQAVIVAVIDDGVTSHIDLPASRILPGRDFADNDFDPKPGPTKYHGMSCAGIIGASHTVDSIQGLSTFSGIISLDGQVNILPVKIFSDVGQSITSDSLAAAITYAWQSGAEVLSNSWGYSTLTCASGFDVITDAINGAVSDGRGGKGCPVIFGSGNSGDTVQFPACVDSAFAVGATQLNDSIWDYSCYGDELDIVAPSGALSFQGDVWTLDQIESDGVNPTTVSDCPPGTNNSDYNCKFGGTSAAAPIVSGIAALLISKDSNLTALEVYDILRFSAVTELDFDTITPPDTLFGYGRVDAFRAALSISRGDLNNDNVIADTLDLDFMIAEIFQGGPDPFPSPLLGDCNCDGIASSVIDLTYLIDYIHRGGPPPINPCFEF